MTAAFESFLVRLYTDAQARRRFLADPARQAAAAGLADDEIAAALAIDRVGLELAAACFARKRPRAPSLGERWRRRVAGWWPPGLR